MKDVMIKVIENVINDRISNSTDYNKYIQLSSKLIEKYKEEINNISNIKVSINTIGEIHVTKAGFIWTIYNREYRDDTNDEDVEEELYKLAQNEK